MRKTKILLQKLEKNTSDTSIFDIIKNGLKLDFSEITFQQCCYKNSRVKKQLQR